MKYFLLAFTLFVVSSAFSNSDSLLTLVSTQNVTLEFKRRNIPKELQDSCYEHWNIERVHWFRRPPIGIHNRPDYPNGNYTKFVLIAFKTDNFYFVGFQNYGGHYIENKFLILDSKMNVVFSGRVDPGKRTPEELLQILKSGKYYDLESF